MIKKTQIIALDTETTIFNDGDPFDIRNKLVIGGYGDTKNCTFFTKDDTQNIQQVINDAKLLVLFNGKFDLHWLRNIGIDIPITLPIWDCQLAEFMLSCQQWPYPSLDESCSRRNLGNKIDVIKLKYWNNGIDTDQIPIDELKEYLKQDILLTMKLYETQQNLLKEAGLLRLFRLHCYDQLVLEEMEYNGFLFDVKLADEKVEDIKNQCNEIENALHKFYPDVPINFSSSDHVSCILFGGTITSTIKLPVGVYKTGARKGEIKYQNHDREYKFQRQVEPLKNSALAKEGYFSTGEDVLVALKAKGTAKKTISLLLERRKLEKLRGTYYAGIPKRISKNCWANNIVHGNLNQCVTNTGRLSATKPNQQNMPGDCKKLCISRY